MSAAGADGVGGLSGWAGEVLANNARHLRPVSDAEVAEDAADHLSHELPLLLSERDLSLGDAGGERGLRVRDEPVHRLVPDLDPDVQRRRPMVLNAQRV